MKKYYFIFFLLLIMGCNKREVRLSKVNNVGIEEIDDHSEIYIFFDSINKKGEMNRSGLISTTNWIFHVDRRNSFSDVARFVDEMQTKKENPMNPHSNPDSRTLFSVADSFGGKNKLKFIEFTKTRFSNFDNKEDGEVIFIDRNYEKKGGKDVEVEVLDKKKEYELVIDKELSFQEFMDRYTEFVRNGLVVKRVKYQE